MGEAIFNDVFGRLEWDRELGGWLGGIDWPPGRHTEVVLWLTDDVAASFRQAREGLEWLQDREGLARGQVAEEMVEVYNEAWADEEGPLTRTEFFHRLELVRIAFEEDGTLLLTYDAGDLFGGHLVDAEFGPDRSFRGADLVG